MMCKIAILGCENSHSEFLLNFVINEKRFPDIEIAGVYSDDFEAAEKLKETYGVYCASSYDEFVGKVDGIVITARHGDDHYKFAKPYIKSGIPMFIDKPITISEDEAVEFMRNLKNNGCKVCGGSSLPFSPIIHTLKTLVQTKGRDKIYGGYLRSPNIPDSPHGGFFFYSQHLIEPLLHIYGFNPNSVTSFRKNDTTTVIVSYDEFDVSAVLCNLNFRYYASVSTEDGVYGENFSPDTHNFLSEYMEFYEILMGKKNSRDYTEFIKPVFVLNAIFRSLQSGKTELINPIPEI